MVTSVNSDAPKPAFQPRRLDVLLVDDEPLIRWSLRRALVDRGHHVMEAGHGTEALGLLAVDPERFDVVVLDHRLPDRQDMSLLSDVRRLAPHAAVFMMTAYGDHLMRAEATALGAYGIVDKPFNLAEFVSRIEAACPEAS
jgi:DNA-binding NtrC family response regulator